MKKLSVIFLIALFSVMIASTSFGFSYTVTNKTKLLSSWLNYRTFTNATTTEANTIVTGLSHVIAYGVNNTGTAEAIQVYDSSGNLLVIAGGTSAGGVFTGNSGQVLPELTDVTPDGDWWAIGY